MQNNKLSHDFHYIQKCCLRGLEGLAEHHFSHYLRIQELFASGVDVSRRGEFQTLFNRFYVMSRRTEKFKTAFYSLFQQLRDETNLDFGTCLHLQYEAFPTVEASFVSKMIATINPNRPVYDSLVRKALGLSSPSARDARKRISQAVAIYDQIVRQIRDFIESESYPATVAAFDKKFPKCVSLSPTKKIDLMLWKFRVDQAAKGARPI
jgi:hypothetical protein